MVVQSPANRLISHWLPPAAAAAHPPAAPLDDLFERAAPIYAFLREHLFRDDASLIAEWLWPDRPPLPGATLLEVGCGPGVYTRRLAARFPQVLAVGVDRSSSLLELAAARAAASDLPNCWFQQSDALALDWPDAQVDAVIAARLFTVVDGVRALREISRVLRPGGRCFIAEPTSVLGTALPFAAMRLAGWVAGVGGVVDPLHRLSAEGFEAVVTSQPWHGLRVFRAHGYQYAVCEKSPDGAV